MCLIVIKEVYAYFVEVVKREIDLDQSAFVGES